MRKAGDLIQRFSESTHIDVLNKACKMMKVRKKLNSFSSNEHWTNVPSSSSNLQLVLCNCAHIMLMIIMQTKGPTYYYPRISILYLRMWVSSEELTQWINLMLMKRMMHLCNKQFIFRPLNTCLKQQCQCVNQIILEIRFNIPSHFVGCRRKMYTLA